MPIESVIVWADRWGEVGIVLLALAAGLAALFWMLRTHQDDCNSKEGQRQRDTKVINDKLAAGEARMVAIEGQLRRGTAKMDGISERLTEEAATIARLDERTMAQGETLIRIEKTQNQLIGFHERAWTDRGDR